MLMVVRQIVQRSWGCPIIESVKIQNGQGFEQHNLVKDVPACGTGVGLNDLKVFLPTQTIL